ncbi:hypothetical protein KJ763_00180 [Patescibacteria group bacterium]|nr:hypothetical protein [Patescibacteria group bacterium]
MKKFINYFLAIVMMFSFGLSPALADYDTASTSPVQQKEKIKQRIEEQKENMAQKFTAQKEKLQQRLEETKRIRVRAYWGRIMGRMGIAVIRLERIADRIDSRLDKLQENGADISEPQVLLETAKTKIADAKLAVENVKTKIEEILNSDADAKDIFQQIKDELSAVKQTIKDAHSALVDVIEAIKPGLLKPSPSPSPSE